VPSLHRIDLVPSPSPREPGRLIDGRYRLIEHLADGGMASVWLALDERLDREVALKIMRPGLAEDPAFVERFRQEARSAARMSHPGLVAMFDQGQDEGDMFLVMEYVPGRTLRQLLADEAPLRITHALDLLDQILDALATAHRAGMVHRDIKPENVIVRPDGTTKVADFGLTRTVATVTSAGTSGVLLGTASYLSPEQVEHGTADARSDVYAAGLLLFEMLTGTKAFDGETAIHVAFQHVHGSVPAPSTRRPGLPEAIDSLVALATARDPGQRPENAADLLVELRRMRSLLGDGPAIPHALVADTQRLDLSEVSTATAPPPTPGLDRTAAIPLPTQSPSAGEAGEPPAPDRSTQRRRRRPVWVLIGLLLALGMGAGWWFLLGPGATAVVPKVVTLSEQDAQEALSTNHLTAAVTYTFDEAVAKGVVITAEPPAGTTVHRGDSVTIVVSKGLERYAVPTLTNTAFVDAKSALAKVNLALGTTTEVFDEVVAKGVIVAQDPPAGSPLKRGSAVSLVVSKGRQPIAVVDWRGKPMSEAVAALTKAGLKVTQGAAKNSDTVPKGAVLTQDPAKGTLFKGDTVTLTESMGPVLVAVPNVVGMQRAEASRVLRKAGFQVNVDYLFGGLFGTVRFQDPAADTMAPKGSTVTIKII
jgi:serine/threonine-protein kinase